MLSVRPITMLWSYLIDINNWIPAIGTTSALTLAMWLFRKAISVRLTQSVKSEFDKKLESLKSELRAKEDQINALRSGALSGLVNRQSKLYEKQIEAIEMIWEAKSELSKGIGISSTMSIIKFEESSKEAAENPKFRELFETIGSGISLSDFNAESARKARPFITPIAWAYFSAYQAIILQAVVKMEMLRKGVATPEKYFNFKANEALIKSVLPHQSDYIEKRGDSAHHYLLEELENLLLLEFQNIQNGKDSDIENTKRADSILKEVDKISKATEEGLK